MTPETQKVIAALSDTLRHMSAREQVQYKAAQAVIARLEEVDIQFSVARAILDAGPNCSLVEAATGTIKAYESCCQDLRASQSACAAKDAAIQFLIDASHQGVCNEHRQAACRQGYQALAVKG